MTNDAQLGDAPWLRHGEVARLLAALGCDGEEARVVGGAVRNALLRLSVDEAMDGLAMGAWPAGSMAQGP